MSNLRSSEVQVARKPCTFLSLHPLSVLVMTSALSQVLEILLTNLKTQVEAGKNLLASETLEELNQSNVSFISTILRSTTNHHSR